MLYQIYKTTNKINGKIYIGCSTHNSPSYLGSGSLIRAAIKKYGKSSFSKEILEYCSSLEEMGIQERFWIKFFNSTDKSIGYNIMVGGFSPIVVSGWGKNPERRKILAERMRSRVVSDETKKKSSEARKFYKVSDETKKKWSQQRKGSGNSFFGRKHTEESKAKISAGHTQERKEKNSARFKEYRKNNPINQNGSLNHMWKNVDERLIISLFFTKIKLKEIVKQYNLIRDKIGLAIVYRVCNQYGLNYGGGKSGSAGRLIRLQFIEGCLKENKTIENTVEHFYTKNLDLVGAKS